VIDPLVPLVLVAAAGIFGGAMWHEARSPAMRRLRLVRRTPRSRIASCADGSVVKIVGTVEPEPCGQPGPLTRAACVAYCASCLDHKRQLAYEEYVVEFAVRDDSAVAAVVPAAPDLALALVGEWRPLRPTPAQLALLARARQEDDSGLGARRWFRERALRAGDRVVVYGRVRRVADGSAASGFREPASRVVIDAEWIGNEPEAFTK
jgi:hypothetical protein